MTTLERNAAAGDPLLATSRRHPGVADDVREMARKQAGILSGSMQD